MVSGNAHSREAAERHARLVKRDYTKFSWAIQKLVELHSRVERRDEAMN